MARYGTASDPTSQKQERHASHATVPKRRSLLTWWPEAIGWTISVLIVAAIAVVLKAYDGVATARWDAQIPITLNATLSLLVTFLYMALMVPIPKCIAQLKWNHYTTSRPLSDVELFDEASRTVWGSAVLLATRPNRLLAALGAFLTLAVAGVGPFVQQILAQEFEPRQLNATMPTVPIFNWTSSYSGATTMITDQRVKVDGIPLPIVDNDAFDAALYAGMIAPAARDFPLAPECAAANCTWDPYWTLVIESECSNLTDRLESGATTGWTLPNGLQTDSAFPYLLTTNYPSVAFQHRGHLLVDFFITVSGTRWDGHTTLGTATAMECILQLRARKVKAEYKNGEWTETQIGPSLSNNTLEARGCSPSRRLLASGEFERPDVVDQTGETLINNKTRLDPLSDQWFSVDSTSGTNSTCNITIATSSAGSDNTLMFPAQPLLIPAERLIYLLGSAENVWNSRNSKRGGITTYLVNVVSGNPEAQASLDQSNNITFTERVDNIAKSLTQTLRASYFENNVVTAGDAYRDTVVFTVTWYWAIVPASLVLLTLVLLILTAWDTLHKGLEKRADSSLALIVFGCDQDVRDSLAGAEDLAAVTKVAKGTRVRLGPGHVLTLSEDLQFKE
ncbi:unnamed protein product [Zymoseptoria tritici ST99CH_3D1]|uniref:Uncharacterized protein n=1 Tax=Zymoseptoria tritici ST99CH_1E4 TaxID=1276532 RepID=A0A2H1FNM9_ZYMTR|nr:unnamed protein product [Zymoseptoria tritici ST99CH_1E4]SMR45118.1 unnamed protein product [Zymoseptoria tritici ST99CH_3D1]